METELVLFFIKIINFIINDFIPAPSEIDLETIRSFMHRSAKNTKYEEVVRLSTSLIKVNK